ncbi:MAG: helix-turn-helix domain-containing protein [Methanosarcina sp.]
MRDDLRKKKALAEVKRAQRNFERDAEAVREARRQAFADALATGLSLREIAEETGLHHSTVAEIARSR